MRNITLIALMMILAGCGSEQSVPANATDSGAAPSDQPTEVNPQNVGVDQVATPGNDPIQNRTYTNTYGNNFCDSQASDLQCWGDIDFHAGTSVQKLLMGRDAICYATTSFNAGIDCYSATLGPITMIPKMVRGSPASNDVENFMNLTVNAQGQMCFKIAQWQGTTIRAIYNVCGFSPTADGGVQ